MAPRASRRKAVTISSDEDDDAQGSEASEEAPKSQKRSSGKLKSVKKKKDDDVDAKAKTKSPQKSPNKVTSKAKTSSKDAPKPASKPIYSFFNNATQKQQIAKPAPAPAPAPAPVKPAVALDDVELIQDDTEDEHADEKPTSTVLAKDSATALAMRKRKLQATQSFRDDSQIPLTGSQKFRKAASGDRVPSFGVINNDKRPWTDQFAPVDLTELAVHKRKVADVRAWLEMAYAGRRQKVLVLKGAAGTGKTTTVQLLAKDLGVELVQWRDSGNSDQSEDGFVSLGSRFEDFVARAGKASSLTLSSDADARMPAETTSINAESPSSDQPRALLIEEFPNTFSRTSIALHAFRSTIAQYVSSTLPAGVKPTPIIMIISETLLSTNTAAADSFTAHRLLGPELITNPYVNVIEFNSVAPTFLTKALETIVLKEARKSGRRRTPGPQVLKHLAESGDLRSAVYSLEFLCLRGDDGDTWSSKVTFTKSKQPKTQQSLTKAEMEALKLITNRESSFGIFHSVGKVVYNKRTMPPPGTPVPQPPDCLPQCRRDKIPETDVDSFMDELGTDVSTFVAALHENYALSCAAPGVDQSLSSLSGCVENLSDADLLSLDRFSFGTRAFSGSATDSLRQDEMCYQVAVRGLLFSLPNPVHRSAATGGKRGDAHRMYYPNSLRLWKRQEEVESSLDALVVTLAKGEGLDVSQAAQASSGTAESWQRHKISNTDDAANDKAEASVRPDTSSQAKKEMLLDRLPYLARIVDARPPSLSNRRLFDQVLSVTRISGFSTAQEDDDEEPDDRDEQLAGEQWATDRPDGEPSNAKKGKTKHNAAFENVVIPVRSRVEQLVLEDDDIVDD
jgi:cell cycle checkpoint protein